MTDDMSGDELTGVLAQTAVTLRDEVPVRPDWRAELLARIEAERKPDDRWRLRPAFAIAAGVALLVAGATIGRFWRPLTAAGPVPENVRFVYVAPGASHVSLVGDFNQWNAEAMPLRRLADGTWIADVSLEPGRYAYAYVVDGKIEVDPVAPRAESDFGENSVLMVRGL